jgi:tyrosyl-tRNA synthetase
MEEVRRLGSLRDAQINEAKSVLAFEVTKLVHGEQHAKEARNAAEALFGGSREAAEIPTIEVHISEMEEKIKLLDLIVRAGLTPSKSEARRAIQQGGIVLNDNKISDVERTVGKEDIQESQMMLQRGKKNFCRIKIV